MSAPRRPTHDEYNPVDPHHPDADAEADSAPLPVTGHTDFIDFDHENENVDTLSHHSHAHLQPTQPPAYPPTPSERPRDAKQALPSGSGSSSRSGSGNATPARPARMSRKNWSSSDLLSGIRKFEHSYEEFDSRNASEAHLAFADGDVPKDKVSRLYNYLLNVSIVTRWILFIVPVMAILWIPGIIGLTKFPNADIWGVKLLWWSIWLSIVWGGWWSALATARVMPHVARSTLGIIAVGARRYIDWLEVLHRYVALTAWTGAIWISWNPLISRRQSNPNSASSASVLSLIGKLLFAFLLCSGVLLFEKFAIQWIAGKFHERSYAERIATQKFAVRSLVTLYRNSSDIPGRTDTLHAGGSGAGDGAFKNPRSFFKRALKGVRVAATTTTTAFGNVASEIAGSSVLQPNSPQAVVKTALESANKSRLLARRLFYSFIKPGAHYLEVEDIARMFGTPEDADAVFALFDKDANGDVSRDEMEMACLEFHREQLSIEHSMQDLDSAVGRLDNILMSVYVIVAILIIAVALEAQVLTLVTGAGTLILGLSWLIGGSLQEVLTSIIFLFVKHPFDVGDRITLTKDTYTVKEIRLLSTVFLDANGTLVQAPNTVLNTLFIQNIRRSPQMSETFSFDVSYGTTFEQLEALRARMLAFVEVERRDFILAFDVTVVDFPDQESMTLKADIKYKSNWQQGALKAKRRNKWICALKTALADVPIFGPKGDPDKVPGPTRYTLIPWDLVEANDRKETKRKSTEIEPKIPAGGWELMDKKAVIMEDSEDVFGESNELHMTNPRRGLSGTTTPALRQRPAATTASPTVMFATPRGPETIEMASRSDNGPSGLPRTDT